MRSETMFRVATIAGLALGATACKNENTHISTDVSATPVIIDLDCPSDETFTTELSGPMNTRFDVAGIQLAMLEDGYYTLEGGTVFVPPTESGDIGGPIMFSDSEEGTQLFVFNGAETSIGNTQVTIEASCREKE